ncbi:MAG: bifunctional diguanylate cyclase/phosphodiesterase [Pseudomonadota bacterium]
MTALVPLFLLIVHGTLGDAALFTLAALIPACVVIVRVAERQKEGARDVITGLPGPEVAANWLDANLKGRETVRGMVVISLSLDEMAVLQDRVSNAMRETILRELAVRVGRLIRSDDLLTRGQGSDFLVCLNAVVEPETENILQLSKRLQAIMEEPFSSGAVSVYCTMSIGVAQVRHVSGANPDAIVRASEAALKQSQESGPGCIRLHQAKGNEAEIANDGDLSGQISLALEAGQIVAWYQPQVSTDTGQISGFEALARWEHPSRGLISPASFIDLSRRSGLSQRLSEVILTHALSALRAWDKAGQDIPSVAVNLGSDDLRNPRVVDYIKWELDRHDIIPARLGIEVLEDVIAERHDDIIARNLRSLADLGCRIELDDFGTGYTSILNIRRFAVSRIKIDRKLVARIDMDKDQRDLVSALLAMAERLNLETLGEGVETSAEHAMLAQLGCDHVQGFALARPMPLGDTFTWILSHRASLTETVQNQLSAATKSRL